jgi:hydrogenase maturation protease
MNRRPGVVVIGVGSPYRGDDGAGPAVLNLLRDEIPDGVTLVPSDGEPTRLVETWTDVSTAIVVDAVTASGSAPGALHRLDMTAGTEPLPAAHGTSSHGLGVGSAVALGLALRRMPGRLIIHGIQGEDFSQGVTLSPAVAARIGDLAAAVLVDVRGAVRSRLA